MSVRPGLSHVAAVSFLAARVAPTGSVGLSLAGGAAVAREAEVRGMRSGYASSAAAMLQTVAIVGPLRINAPLTQAISAPLLGAMHARGRAPVAQFFAALVIRLVHYAILTAFAVLVLLGPKAYAGTYSTLFGWIPFLPGGLALALVVASGTLGASLIGGLGARDAASRAVRGALLVLVPTWLRLAAGSAGLREAFRRMLFRLRRIPGAPEASEILGELDSGALLEGSAKALRDRLKGIHATPMEIADAVLSWAAHEAQSLPVHQPRPASPLRFRPRDATLVFTVLLPASALAAVLVPS